METVFEIFAAIQTAMDVGVMTHELLSAVVLSIAAFIAAQWTAGRVTEAQLHRASGEMAAIADRWRHSQAQSINAVSLFRPTPDSASRWLPAESSAYHDTSRGVAA